MVYYFVQRGFLLGGWVKDGSNELGELICGSTYRFGNVVQTYIYVIVQKSHYFFFFGSDESFHSLTLFNYFCSCFFRDLLLPFSFLIPIYFFFSHYRKRKENSISLYKQAHYNLTFLTQRPTCLGYSSNLHEQTLISPFETKEILNRVNS